MAGKLTGAVALEDNGEELTDGCHVVSRCRLPETGPVMGYEGLGRIPCDGTRLPIGSSGEGSASGPMRTKKGPGWGPLSTDVPNHDTNTTTGSACQATAADSAGRPRDCCSDGRTGPPA